MTVRIQETEIVERNRRTKRRNRISANLEMEVLDARVMLTGVPSEFVSIGRTPSSWVAEEIGDGQFRIRYAVYNDQDRQLDNVQVKTTLTSAVDYVGATASPAVSGKSITWNLPAIAPFGRSEVELTVQRSQLGNLVIDTGVIVTGVVDGTTVTDYALPLALRSGAIAPGSLAATSDADAADPFVMARAAALDQDPARIFEFLTSQIGFESYAGSLRGARGTLWSGAGNALDVSSLGIALLRSSGVPSIYARGTLDDARAGELIGTMFTDPYRATGFIPAGTTVSDPVHHAKLLGETRDHFWIRFDAGAGLTDMDALMPGAAAGQAFATPLGTFAEVPDAMRHKVTIRIDREMVNTAVSGLFGMDPRQIDPVMQVRFSAAHLVGRPLTFGMFVNSSTLAAPVLSATTNTYAPYLAEGDLAHSLNRDHVIRGADFQETITNFPFGSMILTGLFLSIDLEAPDGSVETLERTLFDRIGYDVRTNGGTPNLSFAPGTTAVSELDVTTLDFSSGIQPYGATYALRSEVEALQAAIQAMKAADGSVPPEASDELRLFVMGVSRVIVADYLAVSGFDRKSLADRLFVKTYADKPIVQLASTRLVTENGLGRIVSSLDLRRTEMRAIAFPGQSPGVLPVYQIFRGMRESAIETEVIARNSPSSQAGKVISTVRVFEAAGAAGIETLVLDADQAGLLDTLDYSAEAKARIRHALSTGLIVIVPSSSVLIDDEPTIAWYEVEPVTGRTIGVTSDGGHQAISEFVGRIMMSILEDLALGTLVAAWDVLMHPEILNDPVKLKAYANSILDPMNIASGAKEGLKAGMTPRWRLAAVTGLIGLVVSNMLQTLAVGALLHKADPPAPDFLISLDPLPELSELPEASAQIGVGVAKDPLLVMPVGGAWVPTVFRVGIRNFAGTDRKFRLTDLVAPAGFEIVTSLAEVNVLAGQTAEIGLALRPTGAIPAPGTNGTLSFRVEDVANPSQGVSTDHAFVIPAFGGLIAEVVYDSPGVLPGQSASAKVILRSVGNVGVNVALSVLASDGLVVEGLENVALAAGEVRELPVTLTAATGTPLNSTLTARIRADFGGEEPVWVVIPVSVVAPGADAVVDAAKAASDLGKPDLSARLNDLGIALTNLSTNPDDPVARSQSVVALDSVISQLGGDPVLAAFVPGLDAARDALATAATPEAVRDAILNVGQALDTFAEGVEALRRGNFQVTLLPSQREARPNQPETFEIVILNVGTETTTYRIGLPNLPAGVTGSLSGSSITLAPGAAGSVILTVTQTLPTEVLAFGFSVPVTLDALPQVGRGIEGSFVARREFVSIVDVTATPPFGSGGTQVAVKTRILNAVNTQRDVRVNYVLRNSGGTIVRTGADVAATLNVVTSIATIDLGTIDTTGLADGSYRIEVRTTDLNGDLIPGGEGATSLLIGSPVKASISLDKSVVPPGVQTVTTTLQLDADVSFDTPFALKSQRDFPGVKGVVANGNYVYSGGNDGIRVYDMTDPSAPQLVRTFGTFGQMLEVHNGKLYSMRGGGPFASSFMDIYSLADPANPQLLGTTPGMAYSNPWHMVVTDTHVYASFWSFSFLLGVNDIKYQTGDILAINVENPAAPYVQDVLLNTYGTNQDGIERFLNVDISGGDGNLWQIVQVAPDTLLVAGSTAKGDDTQAGQGVVHVVDISDPGNLKIVKSLVIPGTLAAVALAVEGNRAIVTGSTSGWADSSGDLDLLGSMVLATLELTDPRSPSIIHSETLTRPSAGPWGQFAESLGNGLFVVSTPGVKAGDPKLMVIDISDPNRPIIGSTTVPTLNHGLSSRGNFLFASSDSGLLAFQVGAPAAIPATVRVPVPKGPVVIVPGSFSLAPTRTIDGPDSVTYEWDIDFTSAQESRAITWQSVVTGLEPGSNKPVNLEGSVSFVSQGTAGQFALPATNVAVEHFLTITPNELTVQPGGSASYQVSVKNVTGTGATFDLSVTGIPLDWVQIPNSVFVPAGGTSFVDLVLSPGAFTPLSLREFVVQAVSGPTTGIVGGSLKIQGTPIAPTVETHSRGVVAQAIPGSVTIGRGTAGEFVVRVTNTGSAVDTFSLVGVGVPMGILLDWPGSDITIAPGQSYDFKVGVSSIPGIQPGGYDFDFRAVSSTYSDVTSQTGIHVDVLSQGVRVDLTPDTGPDGATYFATVTNLGTNVDTFRLSLGGPAGLFAALAADQLTLAPGESAQVRVDLGSLAHALLGNVLLAVYAESLIAPAVKAGDTARILLPNAEDVDASFIVPHVTLQDPGIARFLLRVVNSGNVESTYRAVLETSTGPVIVSILGFDGVSPLGNSTFRLPPKSETWIPVYLDLLQVATGNATIRVVSSVDETVAARATASIDTQTSLVSTTTTLNLPADGWPRSQPVPLRAVVTAGDATLPQGLVRFYVDGIASGSAPLVLSNGQMVAQTTIALTPGTHSFRAEFEAANGYDVSTSASANLTVAPDPVVDETGPRVTAVVRYGYHAQPTSFVVSFDSELDPASAGDLANYTLIGAGRDGRFGTRDDQAIRLRSASYSATNRQVTLNPASRLLLRSRYKLVLKGSAGGLADRSGRLLDGNGDGKAGGDHVRVIDQRDLAGPAPNVRALAAVKLAGRKRK